jgi:hypothetical protein
VQNRTADELAAVADAIIDKALACLTTDNTTGNKIN